MKNLFCARPTDSRSGIGESERGEPCVAYMGTRIRQAFRQNGSQRHEYGDANFGERLILCFAF